MGKRGKRANKQRRDVFNVEHQKPVVVHQETGADERRQALTVWPKDKPLPTHYSKYVKPVQPCRKCKRLRLDNMMQAVVCTTSGKETASFRCRACRHTWQLPVRHL